MTKNKSKKRKRNFGDRFENCIGKRTFIELAWKDWKKELPKSGERIYIVLKLKDGFVPVTGTYLDETFPASKDGVIPKTRWQTVKFDDFGCPAIIGGENGETLYAWAKPTRIGNLLNKPA